MQDSYMNMNGKTVLITGATSGIGLEAAVMLARQGAHTVIVGRNPAKTEACLAEIRKRAQSETVESLLCDFSSQDSIRQMAEEFGKRYSRLDVLINNAGTVFAERTLSEDGIEATFAVNHLGYFLLTQLLLETILENAPARIVNVASAAHYQGRLDFEDLGMEKDYGILRAYARSKLCNVLFTRELARRLEGTNVTVNALHPGTVATHIWDGAPGWARPILELSKWLFMISPARGGKRIAYLAMSDDVAGVTGQYFEKNRTKKPSRLARDEALAKRLWDESLRLTGLAKD
ncbi:MAG TPA: SDR family oxidoreductase [Gammaproteobacteria bacterium]|nr:SDR family oxidoreductase [Gammaproteobacteria bacterium]